MKQARGVDPNEKVVPSSTRPPASGRAAGSQNSPAPGSKRTFPALDQPPEAPTAPIAWGKILKNTAFALFTLLFMGATAVVVIVHHYTRELPSLEQVEAGYNPPQVTRVLARDGTVLANLFVERRTVIPFKTIPDHAKLAFLAAEDAGFYEHEGLNYLGMLRALGANLRAGKTRQGGSTITQQVVKNVVLGSERSYERKIKETILARRLEQHLSKDRIFELYLNHIYLGHGRYGIEEASRYYFGKRASELALDQAALLAGLVASPERFSPRNAPERSLSRREYVLNQLLEKGFITRELKEQASRVPLRLAPPIEAESEIAPEIIPVVKKALEQAAPLEAQAGGFTVTTTIDPLLQSMARQAVWENLNAYAKRNKLEAPFTAKERRLWGPVFSGRPKAHRIYVGKVSAVNDEQGTIDVQVGEVTGRLSLKGEKRYNPKHLPPSGFTREGAALRVSLLGEPEGEGPVPLKLELGPESALVAIDPRSREVLALIGSYEGTMGGLDRSTQARRQPGSAFKPLLFSYAIHSRRFTAASVLEVAVKDKPDETRRVRLREGLAKSDNQVAEKVLEECGAENVVQWARAMGIESKLGPTPSLALGAYEVTPLEITNAFTTLASGGQYRPTSLIRRILAPGGTAIDLPNQPPTRAVMPVEEAYLVTSLMESVVQEGTGRQARVLGRAVAGKTGTTNQAKDAWFVGYSTDLVVGVWVGYDDALPLGPGESGSRTALPGWTSFMKAALSDRPKTAFSRPTNIQVVRIDPTSGLLARADQADAIEEVFLEGTEPDTEAPIAEDVTNGEALPGEPDNEDAPPAPEYSGPIIEETGRPVPVIVPPF